MLTTIMISIVLFILYIRYLLIIKDLRLSKDRAEQYLNNVEVIIVGLDSEGKVTLANNKALSVLGYDEEDIIGKDWISCCIPLSDREFVSNVLESMISGDIGDNEYVENSIISSKGEALVKI